MFNYEFLPSHIKYLYSLFEEYSHPRLEDFADCIKDQHENWPNQAVVMDIDYTEYETLYELTKDEPIFAELARELEIEMAD